jgi:Resolvase, N terminal domain
MSPNTGGPRTSSAANAGEDKDSQRHQRLAIEAFAKRAGYEIVESYFDAAVSGANALDARLGFATALMIVSKLKGARQRKRSAGVKVEGRKNYAQAVPATVDRAKALKAEGLTLRRVAERAGGGMPPHAGRKAVSVHGSRTDD